MSGVSKHFWNRYLYMNDSTTYKINHTDILDATVTLIDKTDPLNPTERDYWIYALKTKVSMNLNMEDGFLD